MRLLHAVALPVAITNTLIMFAAYAVDDVLHFCAAWAGAVSCIYGMIVSTEEENR